MRRSLTVAVIVALVLAACSSGENETRSGAASPGASSSEAGRLDEDEQNQADALYHRLLATLDDERVELAAFVVDGTRVETAGIVNRPYAFDSMTKTITGLVLAGLIENGTLPQDATIGAYLNAGPNAGITLVELVTHQSGLPRLAPNADVGADFDPSNPYATYTAAMAEDALRSSTRSETSSYSNFGFQLLGLALERATGSSLGDLAERFVFRPANMDSAAISVGMSRLPPGRSNGKEVPAWDMVLPGPGGAQGQIDDLADYAKALLDPPAELAPLVARATTPQASLPEGRVGYAWIDTGGLTWHNGGSAAYASLIALDLRNHRAAGYLAATPDLHQEALVFRFLRTG